MNAARATVAAMSQGFVRGRHAALAAAIAVAEVGSANAVSAAKASDFLPR